MLAELKGKEQHHILQVAYEALDNETRALLSCLAAFRNPISYDTLSVINPFKSAAQLDQGLDELLARGLLFFDRERVRYDLHPIVRQYAYDRLADKAGLHTRLRDYFAAVPPPEEENVQSLDDLAPVIELYHHTVRAGQYDYTVKLFHDRLHEPLYYRFGAYQTYSELLRTLFPDGENHPPRLMYESAQAWTLTALANSYSLSGQSRRAVPLFEMQNALQEKLDNKKNLAIGLGNLAYMVQISLGELAAAEQNLRRSIELFREINDEFGEAAEHQQLGRLLAYRGAFDEAAQELKLSTQRWNQTNDKQALCLDDSYRTLRALLMVENQTALEASRRALEFWKKDAEKDYPVERDRVQAEWLIGAALVALSSEAKGDKNKFITEAETHLTEALTCCRRINVIEIEPDILLAWAQWYKAKGNQQEAKRNAEEALSIADRCEYRLKQADIHNFLAQLALEAGDRETAKKHAATAHDRAWCDGPPYCYKPALDEAERLLKELAVKPPQRK